jgi:hypothetical protein
MSSETQEIKQINACDINTAFKTIKLAYLAAVKNNSQPTTAILLGPPGIGKTISCEMIARELAGRLGRKFIDVRKIDDKTIEMIAANIKEYFLFLPFTLTQSNPDDFNVPAVVNFNGTTAVKQLSPDTFALFTLKDAAGILFIDEFTNVQNDDKFSSLFKIADEGQIGYRSLSPLVQVICAGNTTDNSQIARQLPDPLRKGKAKIFILRHPEVAVWADWMANNISKYSREIVGFFLRYPQYFYSENEKSDENDDGYSPKVSPRNAAKLAIEYELIKNDEECDDEIIEALINSYLPPKVSHLLMSFLRTFIPDISQIRANPSLWESLSFAAKYMLVLQVAGKKELDVIFELLEMVAEKDPELLIILYKSLPITERQKFITAISRMPRVMKVINEMVTAVRG